MYPTWLRWTIQVQAIAKTGLHYAQDEYDRERYRVLHTIAAEMTAHYSGVEPTLVHDLFAYEQGHVTPKIDVRGVVFHNDALLLTKERGSGKWSLPGGFADVGESPSESTVREVREESGYEVRACRLLAFYDRAKQPLRPLPFHCYRAYFDCTIVGGGPATGHETAAVGFFRLHDLPDLCPSRVAPEQIERLWHLHRHPEMGADFD